MPEIFTPLRLATMLAAGSLLLTAPTAVLAQHAGHTAGMPMPTSAGTLPVTVSKAVVVAVPPSIKETSAYFSLKNTSKQVIRLVGASSPISGHAMLMKTVKDKNMRGMVMTDVLILPAGGTLTLRNDGDHVMLMGLKRSLKVGEVVPITLKALDGRTLTVKAKVQKP